MALTPRQTLATTLVVAALLATAGGFWLLRPAVALTGPAPAAIAPADAQTTAIVAAATGFMATLDDTQRDTVQYDWGDTTQRTNWSNLPIDMVPRGGLAWGDMTDVQRAGVTALLATVLSPDGMLMVQHQMAADQFLADNPEGGPNLTFGAAHYYISFLGEPSETTLWTLQFGGHHLAINATIAGADVTLAPSLTGGQPLRLTIDGSEVWIVEAEVTAAQALIDSLTETQRTTAVQAETPIDLVLGPGEDGKSADPAGLPGSAMTPAQKDLFRALTTTRLGLLNADDQAAALAAQELTLDQTFFGFWGDVADVSNAYWRVTGPGVVSEFSGQDMGGSRADHAHNMWRVPGNDYGALWAAAE